MPQESELLNLLTFPNESLSNEYKSWLDLSVNHGKGTLARAAIALANHGGGVIVLGMAPDGNKDLQSVERPSSISRYTTDSINAAINRFAEPEIHCELNFIVHPISSVEHAVVSVPGLSTVPIMSTREVEKVIGMQRCYIRKPGPRSEEPYNAEEWRGLLNRCVHAGRESMLDAIRAILAGQAGSTPAAPDIDRLKQFAEESENRWLSLVAELPEGDPARMEGGRYEYAFEILDSPTMTASDLKKRMEDAGAVRLTGWGPFIDIQNLASAPYSVDGVIEAWLGAPRDKTRSGRYSDFWRASPTGHFFLLRALDEDFHSKVAPRSSFDITLPIWRLGEALLFVARIADSISQGATIVVSATYYGLKGRRQVDLSNWRYVPPDGISKTDTVTAKGQATAKEISENLAEVLSLLLTPIYECFSFTPPPGWMIGEEVTKLRKGG